MLTLNKTQLLTALLAEVNAQTASTDRKIRLKGRINATVAEMVNRSEMEVFPNLAHNANGGLNKGYIVEDIVLDHFGLTAENATCEVKFFGNETPNVLVNESTQTVYIVVAKATCKGVYVLRDMEKVRGQRLTLSYLTTAGLLTEHCEELEQALF